MLVSIILFLVGELIFLYLMSLGLRLENLIIPFAAFFTFEPLNLIAAKADFPIGVALAIIIS